MPIKDGSHCEIKERDLQAMFELQIQQEMTLAWLQWLLLVVVVTVVVVVVTSLLRSRSVSQNNTGLLNSVVLLVVVVIVVMSSPTSTHRRTHLNGVRLNTSFQAPQRG